MQLDSKPELLAPAGTLETVIAVLEAGADAVYVGGKGLNMRMHRMSYNLDDRQMAAAIKAAHDRGRRLYVTVNSLVFEDELAQARETLNTLGTLCPDGIIVQDLAVAALAREICVHVPLHASTMMNVHSIETATALKLMGFVRVVTSRDLPLHEVRRMAEATGLEMEYFIHGDMCIAQSSQCYGSGILFGESSNRGRCLKSCRWNWRLLPPESVAGLDESALQGHLLARKDLCMFQHIPALVQNRIVSLKIEGRMRTAEFLVPLVSTYREAVDAYFADPTAFECDAQAMSDLHNRRVREFSTCMSLHNSGRESIDPSGKREPRLFSLAKPEAMVSVSPTVPTASADALAVPELAVHVGSPEAAEAAVQAGANAVYLGGDFFVNDSKPIDPAWVSDFVAESASRGVRTLLLGTRVADERDLAEWRQSLRRLAGVRKLGVGVSSLGALLVAREMRFREILADFSMNVANSQAADELSTQGATYVTASLELDLPELAAFVHGARLPVEVVGQGPLPSMVMDHCVAASATGHSPHDVCPMLCRQGNWYLRDVADQIHRVAFDRRCRNHLYMTRDVCVLPNLGLLAQLGVSAVRIEAQFDAPAAVRTLTSTYRRTIDALARGVGADTTDEVTAMAAAVGRPMGDGPFTFGSPAERQQSTTVGSSGAA